MDELVPDGAAPDPGPEIVPSPEKASSNIIFSAKAEQKRHQRKKAGVKLRTAKPRSPVIFKEGKKRVRNSNSQTLSPIPEKRAARKKIVFDDAANTAQEVPTGIGEESEIPLPTSLVEEGKESYEEESSKEQNAGGRRPEIPATVRETRTTDGSTL